MSDLFPEGDPRPNAGARPVPASASASGVPVAGLSNLRPRSSSASMRNSVDVYLELAYRDLLCGGEPGGGESVLLNNIVAHASLCPDVRLVLLDGKEVELGMWREVADAFVGKDHEHAIVAFARTPGADGQPLRLARLQPATQNPRIGRDPVRPRRDRSSSPALSPQPPEPNSPKRTSSQGPTRPRRTGPRRRHHRHRPATQRPSADQHRPNQPAGHLRVPDRIPVHHRSQLRHHPRDRLGPNSATKRTRSTPNHAASVGSSPKEHSPAGSKAPTSPTTTSTTSSVEPPGSAQAVKRHDHLHQPPPDPRSGIHRQPSVDTKPAHPPGHGERQLHAAFTRRVIAAQGRRIATGDVEALPALLALSEELDRAIDTAVAGLRACGYSWTEIASRDRRHPPSRPAALG